jgi:hypothetical protein
VQALYDDYCGYINRNLNNDGDESIASLSTFRRAFILQKQVKLLGSKGAFHTCEICNNALDLLQDKSK